MQVNLLFLRNARYKGIYGYKVYSKNNEDRIIQEIFERIDTMNRIINEDV